MSPILTDSNTHTSHDAQLILAFLGEKEPLDSRRVTKVSTREDRYEEQVCTSVESYLEPV